MRTLPTIVALTASVVLGGCLVTKDVITIQADGSGTIQQSFVVDVKKSNELIETFKMLYGSGDMPASDLPDPIAPGWFRKAAEGVEGYTLETVDVKSEEASRTTTVRANFKSLEAAAKAGAFFVSSVTLEKTEDGAWSLTFKDSLSAAKEASGSAGMQFDLPSILSMLEEQLKGLSITRSITLPTKVLETNGTKSDDGKTVSFTVDFKKLSEGKDLELKIKFEAAETLKLVPFKHSPDKPAIMKRLTMPPPVEEKVEKKEHAPVAPKPGEEPPLGK
jgi:hypothetical protein